VQEGQQSPIGYVVSHYPFISHTFIQREVLGLRQAGFDVTTISVVKTGGDHVLSPTDQTESAQTINVRPVSPRTVWRHLVRPALANPAAVLAILRIAAKGWWGDPKPLLWRCFYVVESILMWSLAASRGVEHLHAHHANSAANMSWLASEFGKRVGYGPQSWSFTLHGSSEFLDVERIDLGRKAEAALGVACISDFTRSQLMMVSHPSVWERFKVVHCGVDPSRYQPAVASLSDPTAPFTVGFVGRLGPEKGLPLLVDAVADLTERMLPRPVELLLIGDGDQREFLEQKCRELGITATFTGAVGQHEIVPLLQQADVLCLTSFREGIPVVAMEAMACEIPVVAPRITALPELIEEDITGLLATAGRADHFADALERLAADPHFARTIAKAGRERVLAEFTTDATVAGMVDFFDEILP